ncbi:MAG: threonine--tRNA ligase [Thaumarchaeota archaeon]|nr:threonine--tRNA ligase [Nitrososphaerota archaeon]
MKILQLHSDFIEYKPIKKEIEAAEDAKTDAVRIEDALVLLVSAEEGDDSSVLNRAVAELNDSIQKLKVAKVVIYPYAHLSSKLAHPNNALKLLKQFESLCIEQGIDAQRAPFGWNKEFAIKVKGHPLAELSRNYAAGEKIEDTSQALKAEEKLRSYWFILNPNGELIDAKQFNFSQHKQLRMLADYEIEKSRAVHQAPPHVELMRRLQIADHEPGSDPGNMRFYPKGRLMKSLIEQYVTQRVKEYGGIEVETPIMYDSNHPSLADYLNRFPARQYRIKSEEKDLFLRFSACFGQFLMVKDAQFSYKQLPLRIYELTRYSFRREKSGELVGLRRLRSFTMPDCHAMCADLEQAKSEAQVRFNLSQSVLQEIGISKDDYEFAIRFTEDFYKENKDFINALVKSFGKPALVEMWKERFFYFAFKWEFNFVDNLGKASALATDQIDVENAHRYGITYVDAQGQKKEPIILHNSPSGAVERVIYALLEKAARNQQQGKAGILPFWLCSSQVRLVPLNNEFLDKSIEIAKVLEQNKIRADIDDRDESVAKKVRDAEKEWIPLIIVIGQKEIESGKLQARNRMQGKMVEFTLDSLMVDCQKMLAGKPYSIIPLPKMVSQRPIFA